MRDWAKFGMIKGLVGGTIDLLIIFLLILFKVVSSPLIQPIVVVSIGIMAGFLAILFSTIFGLFEYIAGYLLARAMNIRASGYGAVVVVTLLGASVMLVVFTLMVVLLRPPTVQIIPDMNILMYLLNVAIFYMNEVFLATVTYYIYSICRVRTPEV